MKRFIKGAAIVTMSSGLLFSSILTIPFHSNAQAKSTETIEQMLAELTPAQRQALEKLNVSNKSGLQLSPDVDLKSPDKVSVIVEFKDKPAKVAVVEETVNGNDLSLADAKQKADEAHKSFQNDLKTIYKEDLKKNNDIVKIKRTYKSTINGVAMELPADKVESLLKSDAVQSVWSNHQIKIDPPANPGGTAETKSEASETFPGVNKLHNEGLTGKGIKVGVIDTGIDYNHPDLTDAYKGYRTQKGVDPKTSNPSSVKGWDFVDNDADPMETTYEDWKKSGRGEFVDGSAFYTEHGTHVAGIIAGRGKNNTDYAVTGVAPDAEVYAYRVLGPWGSGSTEAVLGGIDKAVSDGMDVINLSLGSNYNDPTDIESIAVNNAVLSGVTAIVAAGNSGENMYTLGAPGAASLAITVGANDTAKTIAMAKGSLRTGSDVPADLKLLAKGFDDKINTLKGQTLPIVFIPGIGDATSYVGKDVNGKIVLVNRGTLGLDAKVKEAGKNGAKAVLLVNNVAGEGFIPSYLGEGYGFIPTFSISNEQGTDLRQKLTSGSETFSFDEITQTVSEGNKLADFSSRGPARITYDIKPEVTAPGVAVFSTVPSYMHGADQIGNYQYAYENLSGTSMATPNVAGVAALLLQANPDLTPAQVKETLMNTADPLNGNYSVYEVGAGQVDPYEAIHSQTRIEVIDETEGALNKKGELKTVKDYTGALAFGTVAPGGTNVSDHRSLTVYNNSKQAKTFNVTVSFQTDHRGSKDADSNGVMIETDKTLKVNANAKKKTVVSISVPKTATIGTYEGYVTYSNQKNPEETFQVPFAIRTVEEGINSLSLSPQAFTRPFDSAYPGQLIYTNAFLNLKSHMRTVDVILVDGKTNEDIGFVGSLDGLLMNENTNLSISQVFKGYYYPLTGNPEQPIAYDQELAKPGYYKLKFVGTNDTGKTFAKDAAVYFDNLAPKLKLDLSSDVVEYKPGTSTVTVTGSIFDKETEEMKAAGLPYTQGSNRVFYQDQFGGSAKSIPVKADGTFTATIPVNQTRPMLLAFYGMDVASNKTFKEGREIYFVRDDQPYGFLQPEKRAGNMGETVHSVLSLNKGSNVKQAVFKLDYYSNIASIKVTPHASVTDQVRVKVDEVDVTPTRKEATITVTLKDGASGLSGNLSLADVAVTMKNDYDAFPAFFANMLKNVSYTDMNGETKQAYNGNPALYMIPTHSQARGGLDAEALMIYYGTPDQQPKSLPYSTMGIKVKATGSDGKIYNGAIGQELALSYRIPNLPLTDEPFQLEFNVPGHFTVNKQFTIGFHEDGIVINQNLLLPYHPAIAGDVNKDDVIDVLDALYIQTHWGTNKREADINYDGNVNAKDFAFVEKNYLMQNPTIKNAPIATKKVKGATLESIKSELDIH